jgi:hypothetical protein
MKRPGKLVKTEKGHKGIIYNDDPIHNGKYQVRLIDEKFKPTGVNMLCSPDKLTTIGFID